MLPYPSSSRRICSAGRQVDSLVDLGVKGLQVDLNVAVGTGKALRIVQSAPHTTFVIEHLGGAPAATGTAYQTPMNIWGTNALLRPQPRRLQLSSKHTY